MTKGAMKFRALRRGVLLDYPGGPNGYVIRDAEEEGAT